MATFDGFEHLSENGKNWKFIFLVKPVTQAGAASIKELINAVTKHFEALSSYKMSVMRMTTYFKISAKK